VRILLLIPGDEDLLIAATRLLNDVEIGREKATQLLADPTYVHAVALNDRGDIMSRVYGHVLQRHDSTDLLLYEVDTDEKYRRLGAARAIVDFLGALCRERGYGEMWVLTEEDNVAARALYEGAGGEEEGSPAVMYVFPTQS
jgi:ribosomal protein S18 acetylase RimI-like enzyme